MKKLNVAIFGTGFMGRVHTEAVRRLGNVEVVGIAGSSNQKARRFAEEFVSSMPRTITENYWFSPTLTLCTSALPMRCILRWCKIP